jgi:hypothetical protein
MLRKLICSLCLLSACVGTEVGNPEDAQVDLVVTGYQRPADRAALTLDGGVRIDSAWLIIEELELREAATCEDIGRTRLASPVALDLLAAPRPLGLVGAQTRYCRLELRIGRVASLPAGAPAELEDSSIVVRGARADGTPFVLRSRLQERLRVRGDFSLDADAVGLILAFALDRWLAPATLDAATPVGGQILIDEDNNDAALSAFEAAVTSSADLFRDVNRDGSLQQEDLSRRVATSQ